MPKRYSTRLAYESWFRNHILLAWGNRCITDLQARPVELRLDSLDLSPKSRVHIRTLVRELWDLAMWAGHIPVERNPMELVTVRGATRRTRKPRSLTVEEFQKIIRHLEEPFRTLALVCVCFGLRISECLALKWSDVDWLNSKLSVERGIVRQQVGEVKTIYSGRLMAVDAEMLEVLRGHLGCSPHFVYPNTPNPRHRTRLGELGADAFAIRRLAGHSSICLRLSQKNPISISSQPEWILWSWAGCRR